MSGQLASQLALRPLVPWLLALVVAVLGLAGRATGEANPAARVACDGALVQGGLLVCRAPAGSVVELGTTMSEVPASGLLTYGLPRDAPQKLAVRVRLADGTVEAFDLSIAPRDDPVRRVEGLDCDKVDARSDEQKAHAARSWTKKVDAFSRFEAVPPGLTGFDLPAEGRPTSPFGPVRTYVGVSAVTGEPCEKTSVHRGYDIAAPVGTPIRAPAPGTVILADDDLYYEGGTIFLDHGHGLVSVFMHMSAVDVAAGQDVMAGDRLGAVGNTGRTTGPHLHWAVKWRDESASSRNGDRYIDPELLLDLPPSVWTVEPTTG